MICFNEQQKREIVHTGILVIEFKRSIVKACETLKDVFVVVKDALLQLADRILKSVQLIRKEYRDMPPKKRYKTVRRLDKCCFTEKEINLMIGGAYHCRNNC
ncbi:hypothetical protein [Lacrimispora sp.]|uniref:hypothetical protein n=1 Tax=Lacrimispora sp. TaxID=2719234 RepID=UPI00345FA988